MKVASWNVNSIRARLERLQEWLLKEEPDVVCLQELKVTDDVFPYELLESLGYASAVYGQKTYNGVAVLSRSGYSEIRRGFQDGLDEEHARLIAVEVGGIPVISAYIPNGEYVGSEKYAYKLDWMKQLRTLLDTHYKPTEPLLLCGDFNAAPEEIDVARPEEWRNTVLYHEDVRSALRHITTWGLQDTLRLKHPEGGIYSWWDYRALAFPKNNGLRIDQIYATRPLADRCKDAYIDREARKGEKPSDHAPVVAIFEDI